ncbi:PH domain-containing protein [Trueperella sp. LYQ143]|uniref:PH domain-containing protein n=1 Tax=unclassified Trueperella TaxID=2630174 RepID=UPI00398389D8
MGFSQSLLGRDEYVVRHMHEHPKALISNVLGLIVVLAGMIAALIFLPDSFSPWGHWAVVILALILIILVFVYPYLQWWTSTYTVTNRRIITRQGIFAKTGHDIPLARISNVSYDLDLIDRIFRCGTLILETSASDPLILKDIPDVERMHVELTELLNDSSAAPTA